MPEYLRAVLLAGLLGGVGGAVAAGDVSVAVVNVMRLQTEAPQIVLLRESIKDEFAAREAALEVQRDQVEKLEQKLIRERGDMSETEAKSLQRDIRSRTLRLSNAQEELDSDRRLRLSEEMDRLRRVLSEVIAQVAREEGLDLVLESGVAWASERADITERVLVQMRMLQEAQR